MLYDNAQLVSLYAEAYTWQRNELYKNIVDETITFVQRELMSPDLSDAQHRALIARRVGTVGAQAA